MNYSFTDLFAYFYARWYAKPMNKSTKGDNIPKEFDENYIVNQAKITRKTLYAWLTGKSKPKSPTNIVQVGLALGLSSLQIDTLLYATNKDWIKRPIKYFDYSKQSENSWYPRTSPLLIEGVQILRYREYTRPEQVIPYTPNHHFITDVWGTVFFDNFADNSHNWGLGEFSDGMYKYHRYIEHNKLTYTVQSNHHVENFTGADSNCFAPTIYYCSVEVQMKHTLSENDGYCLLFDVISDHDQSVFRIREHTQQFSVFKSKPTPAFGFGNIGGFDIYLNRKSAPSINQGGNNLIAIIAYENFYWFYINNALVGESCIPRYNKSRLDLGVIAGAKQVTCEFRNFRVLVPNNEDLQSSFVQKANTHNF